jgi:replicative DNA helicase
VNLPPQNIEAERGVVGAMIISPEAADDVAAILEADDFFRDSHAILFRAVCGIRDRGGVVDPLTIGEWLSRNGLAGKVDDDAVIEIAGAVPHAVNAIHHASIVREHAVARRVIAACEETLRDAYARNMTAGELVELAETRVFAVSDTEVVGQTLTAKELSGEAMERIVERMNGGDVGLSFGFPDLDRDFGGMPSSGLVVVAARPGHGKTAFAMNVAQKVIERGTAVLFVSLEMAAIELAERYLVQSSGVDGHRVRSGQLNQDELRRLDLARVAFRDRSLHIDDTAIRTPAQIVGNARRCKAKHNIGLVIVDYIGLVEPGMDKGMKASRQEQVANISRRFKLMAKELGIPVMALSQLNRQCESRDDKRPRLSDLRESGGIEQDADMVLMLHRPEVYDCNDTPGLAEVAVAKNRNGRVGVARLTYLKHCTRFESYAAPVAY